MCQASCKQIVGKQPSQRSGSCPKRSSITHSILYLYPHTHLIRIHHNKRDKLGISLIFSFRILTLSLRFEVFGKKVTLLTRTHTVFGRSGVAINGLGYLPRMQLELLGKGWDTARRISLLSLWLFLAGNPLDFQTTPLLTLRHTAALFRV